MEKILAIIGGMTSIVLGVAGLMAAVNLAIRRSSLLANSIWEIKKYGFKRIKKDGTSPIID